MNAEQNKDSLQAAIESLREFTTIDTQRIHTLSDLLLYVPILGEHLYTILQAYGSSYESFLPLDLPAGESHYDSPLLSFSEETKGDLISLQGRKEGLTIQKRNQAKLSGASLDDDDPFRSLRPTIEVAIPTSLHPQDLESLVFYALSNQETVEYVYPSKKSGDPQEQRRYAELLQVLIKDLLSVIPKTD